ncbi:MAG: hypothetical protein IJQ73_11120 [Kiritimatiellae bacterium]|nr:hypothetical protein [Kiritimatiellia bacterium]
MRPFLQSLRSRLGELWWYTMLGFIVARMGEVVNLYIGVFLVPKVMPAEELGAVTPLMSVGAFVGLPIALLLLPVGKFLNVFAAKKEYGKVKALLLDSIYVNLAFAVVVLTWLAFAGDGILERMHVTDRRILIPVAAFAVLSCLEPIIGSAQRSLKCFRSMLIAGLGGPYVRLVGMLLLLAPFGAFGYLSAQLGLSLWGIGCALVALHLYLRKCGGRTSYREDVRDMVAYSIPLVALTFAGRVQGPVEAFVIRHRLPEEVSAGYYFSTMFGAIPGYFTSALVAFFWPIVSEKFEKGESTHKLLMQSMLFNLAVGGIALLAVALVVPYVFRLRGPWQGYEEYSRFVWQAGLITLLKSVQGLYTTYESACRRFVYVRYMVPLMLLEAAVLYGLPAWGGAAPYVPAGLWRFVNAHWANTLPVFLRTIIFFNLLFTLAMTADWLLSRVSASSHFRLVFRRGF